MIEIDGSLGESGGQILRTALSLSCLLRQPFRIYNIRKNRSRPGLMPQHLMCVQALAQLSHATVQGDKLGAEELVFAPGETTAGKYSFDIGTAGSTSLLFQCLLPPLLFCRGRTHLSLTGGTHVPFSPTFQYISNVFIPFLKMLGFHLYAGIERYGFYPKGGGLVTIGIEPAQARLHSVTLLKRASVQRISGLSGVGNLPLSISHRQKNAAEGVFSQHTFACEMESLSVPSVGQGTFVFVRVEAAESISGFSSLGARGKKAETVGKEAAEQTLVYLSTDACLDPQLADQIVLYLAFVPGESTFTTSSLTEHLLTNLQTINHFLDIACRVSGERHGPGTVTLKGRSLFLSA